MDDLISLRRGLHANPELSGAEQQTARRIATFFQALNADQTVANLGGNGIAFVFDSRQPGPSVLFRCELDAIPVHEENDLAYRSHHPGRSHNCGHDGHMAIRTYLNPPQTNQPKKRIIVNATQSKKTV
jgi:metal-dependent amidase/aminoacylase/carboxypeptidase family protein